MDYKDGLWWIYILLSVGPVVLLTREHCKKAGVRPTLPVLGLLIGLFLQIRRDR